VITTSGEGSAPFPIGSYDAYSVAIGADTLGASSDVIVNNSGAVKGLSELGVGIATLVYSGNTEITNSGSVYGGYAAILAESHGGGTKIVNTGDISAGSNFAIGVYGGPATIYNSGYITGFVRLTPNDDTFINQDHGVFETKLTSYFGGGNDLFRNEEGGTVLAATNPNVSEYSSFVGLERFENQGLISLQDGKEGDVFRISNTVGGTDLSFWQIDLGHRCLPRWSRVCGRQFHHRRQCGGQDRGASARHQ
jgi:hypothetical protein